MNIEIQKKQFMDGSSGYYIPKRSRLYTLYVVTVDGRRVDSFLKYRNAQRKVRQLRENSRSANQGN